MADVALDANVLVAWFDGADVLHDNAKALLDRLRDAGDAPVFLALLLASLVATVGCGGRTRATGRAPYTHMTIGCPATIPQTTANGGSNPCSNEGQWCEYGNDYDPRCNVIVECSLGQWLTRNDLGGLDAPKCGVSVAPTLAPNPPDCPATPAAIDAGSSCSASSTCNYGSSNCSCDHYCRLYPIPLSPCNPDAGFTQYCCDLSGTPYWTCFDGPPYCATNRPSIGDPCTQQGASCAITPAVECEQQFLICNSGHWEPNLSSCPISTARAKRDINYLGPDDVLRLRKALLDIRLARYRYILGDPSEHLGFVIEDMPAGSPAVLASRDRVDLYGYLSMAVATIQEQQRQIDALKQQLDRMEQRQERERSSVQKR
jgi:hypothetical protein